MQRNFAFCGKKRQINKHLTNLCGNGFTKTGSPRKGGGNSGILQSADKRFFDYQPKRSPKRLPPTAKLKITPKMALITESAILAITPIKAHFPAAFALFGLLFS